MVDSIILYDYDVTNIENNGLGPLNDAISCIVTEERNGAYELEMEYPMNGVRFNDIGVNKIIVARPNKYDNKQMFRIYEMTKTINQRINIKAQHISYDMSGYIVRFTNYPNEVTGAQNAITNIKNHSTTNDFTITTVDYTDTNTKMIIDRPGSLRSLIGSSNNSFLSIFGGDISYDNYNITLHKNGRGVNRGVVIRYGKNLTDLNQEEKFSNLYTGVYPYYYKTESDETTQTETINIYDLSDYEDPPGTIKYPGGIIPTNVSGIQNRVYIYEVNSDWDNSHEWGEPDEHASKEEMEELALKLIEKESMNKPEVNLTFSFQPISDTTEYYIFGTLFEDIRLCDTVIVEYEQFGVKTEAAVTKISYNVLNGKYESIDIGERSKLTDNFIE